MRKVAGIIGILAMVGALGATETRVWTFAQGGVGYLTDDEVIIQFYPGQMFRFGSFVTVENPVVPNDSIAGVYRYASAFYTGEDFGFGIYLGRSRTIGMVAFDPIRVAPVDLVFGVRSGGASFGLNLTFNKYSYKDYDIDRKRSATVFGLRPGFTVDLGGDSYFDGAFFIDYTSGAVTDTLGNDIDEKRSTFGLGFQSRFVGPVVFPFEVIFSKSSDTLPGQSTYKSSLFFMAGGPGTQVHLDAGSVLANMVIYFTNITNSDTTSHKELGIETRLGGEFNIWRGLIVRGSLRYDLLKFFSSNITGRTKYFTIGDFGPFTLGLGYDFGFARVDVGVSTDLLTNGPYFLTGNSGSALITMLSVLGKF